MKQRFSSLDVRVISLELSKTLISLRVANIYDLSSRIFLFKFAKPGTKEQLLVDSGFRCHLTAFSRTTAAAPSAFVTRLRKYLKTRRVTSVTQVGTDRIIELQFSDGQYRLFLEFFAAGNVVLTDTEFNVLALLRTVSEGSEDVDVKLGSTYSLKAKQNYHGVPPLSKERAETALAEQVRKAAAIAEGTGKKPKKKREGDDLRKALTSRFPEYPAHLVDHAFNKTGFDPSSKPEWILEDPSRTSKLVAALEEADRVFRTLSADDNPKGYIIAKAKEPKGSVADEKSVLGGLLYDDFHPFRPSQFEDKEEIQIIEVDGFNKTADQFFSSLESQRLESRLTEREQNAKRKLDNARQEHEKRLGALQQVQDLHVRQAEAITANTHRVQEAIDAVNGLIAQGMDWTDIAKLIESEQKRDNLVAKMIKLPLKLYENTVTLLLAEAFTEEENERLSDGSTDSESEGRSDQPDNEEDRNAQLLVIDIDLALSPWANASNYYDQKKSAAQKEHRTMQSSAKALKNAEKKITGDLKKELKQEKQVLQPTRKQMWFEKFLFFISSDGYLVLGGKDAQQNEVLYRRYLKRGDAYVYADLQGAASVIVKNTLGTPDAPIPPSTLSQAGALSVCTSSAWDSKAVMAAWWVNADQVSKTAPTGEYIITGGFMVRGKKNFLPPSQLLLGFGVMFQISEDSKKNHNRHRLQYVDSAADEEKKVLDLADSVDQVSALDIAVDEARQEVTEEAEPPRSDLDFENGHDAESTSSDEGQENESNADSTVSTANPLQTNNTLTEKQEDAKPNSETEEITEPEPLEQEAKEELSDHKSSRATTQAEPSPDDTSDTNTKRHLTARERRLLRKGKATLAETSTTSTHGFDPTSMDDDAAAENSEKDSATSDIAPSTTTTASTAAATTSNMTKSQHLSRGKRTKLKRAAQKYSLQDDEDRALAMSLLGSTSGAQQKKAEQEASRQAREVKSQRDKERRRAQHDRAVLAERRRQEVGVTVGAAAMGGDGDEGEGGEDPSVLAQERLELANLDCLVGWPMPGDEILAAIPVCAPWAAVATRCKYKVKLQPGSVKKGKAVREIVGMWVGLGKAGSKVVDTEERDREKVWLKEVGRIAAWRVEEMIGGCRSESVGSLWEEG